jgi:hypothetical protein
MEQMKSLTKADILKVEDLDKEWVDIPEWNGGVYVRVLTGTERDNFEASVYVQKGKKTEVNMQNMRAKLCAKCMIDEEGKRIFDTKDIKMLGSKSSCALDRVFEVAQRLNGMTKKDIDDLVGNSKGGQNDLAGLSSPPDSEDQLEESSAQ